jgi:hypothetical protein
MSRKDSKSTVLRVPLMAEYKKIPELSVSSVFGLRPEELE